MPNNVRFTSLRFRHFTCFDDFQVSLTKTNVLVGANNCGKSTVIGAFRALAAGLTTARARPIASIIGPDGRRPGYRVPTEAIPISLANVHTNYAEVVSTVTFRLSNGNRLLLSFPDDEHCYLIPDTDGPRVRGPTIFRDAFPVTIGVVLVLGPVEHDEEIVQAETVRRSLATHRASRHFRNYWYQFPEQFDRFASMLSETWPRMELQRPHQVAQWDTKLAMFCSEHRVLRELYWAGSGFQIWCQLLTHVTRHSNVTLLIVDEPELYLHPDLQRRFVALVRSVDPDVLLATHSTEIIREVAPLTSCLLIRLHALRSAWEQLMAFVRPLNRSDLSTQRFLPTSRQRERYSTSRATTFVSSGCSHRSWASMILRSALLSLHFRSVVPRHHEWCATYRMGLLKLLVGTLPAPESLIVTSDPTRK